MFLSVEPLKSLGRKANKTQKRQGNSLQQKKQGYPTKQGKEDQGTYGVLGGGQKVYVEKVDVLFCPLLRKVSI